MNKPVKIIIPLDRLPEPKPMTYDEACILFAFAMDAVMHIDEIQISPRSTIADFEPTMQQCHELSEILRTSVLPSDNVEELLARVAKRKSE